MNAFRDFIRERVLTNRNLVIALAGAGLLVGWVTWAAFVSCAR